MPAIPIAALALTAVGTGYSIYSGQQASSYAKKGAAAQQEAVAAQKQQNDLQAARQRRDAIRAARVAGANAVQTANNQGVAQSSAAQGGQASIGSQLNDTLSFLDQYNFLSDTASDALGKASVFDTKSRQASANAETGQQIAQFGMSVFGNSGEIRSAISKVKPK